MRGGATNTKMEVYTGTAAARAFDKRDIFVFIYSQYTEKSRSHPNSLLPNRSGTLRDQCERQMER